MPIAYLLLQGRPCSTVDLWTCAATAGCLQQHPGLQDEQATVHTIAEVSNNVGLYVLLRIVA